MVYVIKGINGNNIECFFCRKLPASSQDGTTKWDIVEGSTMGDDGFVIMVGVTRANWARLYTGSGTDFMAVCLDASNGTYEAWRWQVRYNIPLFSTTVTL